VALTNSDEYDQVAALIRYKAQLRLRLPAAEKC
jgi:hypothetical protein